MYLVIYHLPLHLMYLMIVQSGDRKGAWGDMTKGGALLMPTADRHGGSVQVVSSTNGELGPSDVSRLEGKSGAPLHTAPEVEVVEETKYDIFSILYFLVLLM